MILKCWVGPVPERSFPAHNSFECNNEICGSEKTGERDRLYLRHQSNGTRGAAIGVGVGLAASSPAAVYPGSTNHQGLGAVALVAGATAGWYIGHHFFDRDRTDTSQLRIAIAPQEARAP